MYNIQKKFIDKNLWENRDELMLEWSYMKLNGTNKCLYFELIFASLGFFISHSSGWVFDLYIISNLKFPRSKELFSFIIFSDSVEKIHTVENPLKILVFSYISGKTSSYEMIFGIYLFINVRNLSAIQNFTTTIERFLTELKYFGCCQVVHEKFENFSFWFVLLSFV